MKLSKGTYYLLELKKIPHDQKWDGKLMSYKPLEDLDKVYVVGKLMATKENSVKFLEAVGVEAGPVNCRMLTVKEIPTANIISATKVDAL